VDILWRFLLPVKILSSEKFIKYVGEFCYAISEHFILKEIWLNLKNIAAQNI